ncbi:hypothetical protein [Pectinatus haikarae]|uniref:hypothetical protein n=1 Tax=Pectinatus haikarae TaxID=349096 RepID=UPI0027D86743|nr:hypothetical protein [Pectinatus haikarae]
MKIMISKEKYLWLKKNLYLQSIQSILDYQKTLRHNIYEYYQFPELTQIKYITVGRQVELIVYVEYFSKWEKVLLGYGDEHNNFKKYYPLILNFMKKYVLPKKEKDYSSHIRYYHLFNPCMQQTLSYSISLTVYDDNIFKHLTKGQGSGDDSMAADISRYYREQNLRGPEWVTVVSLDKIFVAIIISGVTSPFWHRYQQVSLESRIFFKDAIKQLSKEAIEFSFKNHNIAGGRILFSDFQWKEDTIFIVAIRDKESWEKLLKV